MTVNELRELCKGGESIILHMGLPLGSGYTRRLLGRRGPRGVIISGKVGSHQLVRFESKAVLRYLDKMEKP